MDLDRTIGQRRFGAFQDRQRVEFDLDGLQGRLCLGLGVGGHRQDGIADIADLVRAEHGAIRHLHFQEIGALDIRGSQHPGHPRHLLGLRRVDGDDAGMGHRTAQNGQFERPLDPDSPR